MGQIQALPLEESGLLPPADVCGSSQISAGPRELSCSLKGAGEGVLEFGSPSPGQTQFPPTPASKFAQPFQDWLYGSAEKSRLKGPALSLLACQA